MLSYVFAVLCRFFKQDDGGLGNSRIKKGWGKGKERGGYVCAYDGWKNRVSWRWGGEHGR